MYRNAGVIVGALLKTSREMFIVLGPISFALSEFRILALHLLL